MKLKQNGLVFAWVCMLLLLCSACGKQCECKEWLNGVANNPYQVDFEGDGTYCSDYSTIVLTDSIRSGIECIEL